ncbi:MAG: type II toxin-antitoxin system HicB family antitoxin [Thermomicrobiales bacterium]
MKVVDQQGLQDVLDRKYSFIVRADPEVDSWLIVYPDLPGCISQADSYEEIGERARDVLVDWVSAQLEDGRPIPLPRESPLPEWDWSAVGEQLLSSAEAAKRLGVTQRRVLALAKSRGVGQKFGRSMMFSEEDLQRMIPGPVGRPAHAR